ncbi:MAG: peptidoglycan DD-metalloendopeptidase family protein [Acidimicrobiia bacterium]
MRLLAVTTSFLVVMSLALPAGAEVTRADLDAARAEINSVGDDLEDEMEKLEAALDQQTLYEAQITRIQEDIDGRDREIALAAVETRDRARSMYVSAGAGDFQAVVSPESITRIGTKKAYLDAVVDLDLNIVNQLEFLRADRAGLQQQIEALAAQQEDLAAELDARATEILDQLTAANDRYQTLYGQWQQEEAERRRRAEEERRRQAAAAAAAADAAAVDAAAAAAAASSAAAAASSASSGNATGNASGAFVDSSGRTCPVAGANSFSDTWGAPRSGGRTHKGVDMTAAIGTPLVAVESGYIWSPNWHWAGGNGVYVRGDSGDIYYYAHMKGYAPGLYDGMRVGAGQLVGYVGNTGNSSVPHLHLGWQPGGGPLTNPYQLMVKLCR